jgi:stage II sporulation protein D
MEVFMNRFYSNLLRMSLIGVLFCSIPMTLAAQSALADRANAAAASPLIRVGIWSNQPNLIVGADADFHVVDENTHEIIGNYGVKEKVTISSRSGNIWINGVKTGAQKINVISAENGQKALIEVNRQHYRGNIEIHRTVGKSGLTVVNTLPVDEYLYSVVAKEMSPDWNKEALKAQAVAARTYAMVNQNKYHGDGYGIGATPDCQIYVGADSEAAETNAAVDETSGLVVTYQDKLIDAAFHSSGGGYTENSENVWGGVLPYLRGVVDYDQKMPNYRWEKQLTPSQVDVALAKGGIAIGPIQAFELSHFTGQPENEPDRGISGRVKTLRLIGSAGSVEITGSKLRSLLGLHSTLFDIQIMLPSKPELEFEITDGYGRTGSKKVPSKLPLFPVRKTPGDGDNIERLTGDSTELIVMSGYGYGHGLGLSQWGAKVMADKAPAGDSSYFRQILKHYYQGVEVTKLY